MCCDADPVSLSTTKISTSFPLILISDEVYFLPFRVDCLKHGLLERHVLHFCICVHLAHTAGELEDGVGLPVSVCEHLHLCVEVVSGVENGGGVGTALLEDVSHVCHVCVDLVCVCVCQRYLRMA